MYLLYLTIFIILYKCVPIVRFSTKVILFYLLLFTLPLICMPLAIFSPRNPRNVSYLSWISINFVNHLYGLKWNIKGKSKLQNIKSAVIVCNHQCFLDALGILNIHPFIAPSIICMKKSLLYSGPFGIYAYLARVIFLDRKNTKESKEALNAGIMEVKNHNWKIMIFPEGTRNNKDELLPFKKGAFHIAVAAKIPIIPIVFHSYKHIYDLKNLQFEGGSADIEILDPVHVETNSDINNLCQSVREQMNIAFNHGNCTIQCQVR